MARRLASHGLLAEFGSGDELVAAVLKAREAGYRHMDAYTPMPVHGLAEALGFRRTRLPLIVLLGGIVGALTGYGLQYWVSAIAYPLNIGGRPLHSWPAFVPITFEMTILFASGAAVLGLLALNGLPMPYHPLFNVRRFKLASRNRFFLCIESSDPLYEEAATRSLLESLDPRGVYDVED